MNVGAAEPCGERLAPVRLLQQPVPQQPVTIFQQIPGLLSPFAQPVRPGHIREDLVELMMIQNAQMHQVILNNMTLSALASFGYSPALPAAQVKLLPLLAEDEEADLQTGSSAPTTQRHGDSGSQRPASHRYQRGLEELAGAGPRV
nr:proline-rich protein 29 [Pelodiscus sinensis]|eukprot:XP_025037244.1 proline-rich protein 29 [Pelodiscus sinensis]